MQAEQTPQTKQKGLEPGGAATMEQLLYFIERGRDPLRVFYSRSIAGVFGGRHQAPWDQPWPPDLSQRELAF
jgi:hypothetical protein